MPRRREIEAAIAAHNDADRETLLPPDAVRLLSVMFRRSSVCRLRPEDLVAEGFDDQPLRRLLRGLIEAGLVSMVVPASARGHRVYRLHLPPVRR